MDVRCVFEITKKSLITASAQVELSGWLVIINGDLYLLEENLPKDYKQAVKLRLTDKDIIYAVRQTILPLGGGESFVFHRAKIVGLLNMETPEILAKSLCVQERGHDEFVAVDITQNAIAAGKMRYEAALSFDFFKEMDDE